MKNRVLQRNLLYAAGGIGIIGVVLLIVFGYSPRIYSGLGLLSWLLFYLARRVDPKRHRKI